MFTKIYYSDRVDTNPIATNLSEVKALSYLREALVTSKDIFRIELFSAGGKLLHTLEQA